MWRTLPFSQNALALKITNSSTDNMRIKKREISTCTQSLNGLPADSEGTTRHHTGVHDDQMLFLLDGHC